MSKKFKQSSKRKHFTKTLFDRAEDITKLAGTLHNITSQPVTVSAKDWKILRQLGRLSMRIPHDAEAAYLGLIPVKMEIQ